MQGEHRKGAALEPVESASTWERLKTLRKTLLGRAFLPFWLALAAVVAALPLSSRFSEAQRVSNLDLTDSSFTHSYLMTSKTEPNRGYLVDRRDSTVRRSRKNLPGKMWNLDRFGEDTAAGIPEHFLVRSKNHGTVFLVPVEAIQDFEYPFLYDFVRRVYPELQLTETVWSQLFLDRVYHGLYLRMTLPFDLRKKAGGNGILRELLMVRENEMTRVDTRLNPNARFFEENTTLGLFPALREPLPALTWLAARSPTDHVTLLLSNVEPYEASLLPLPHSVDKLYKQLEGIPLETSLDDRFVNLLAPVHAQNGAGPAPLDQARRERFEQEFHDYARSFESALAAHRRLRPSAARHASMWLEQLSGEQELQSRGAWR